MRKLLSGNFARLWKSRVFWVLQGFSFGFGVFAYALVAYNTRNLGQGWLEYEAHGYFFLWVFYIAVIIALFACFFIGTDYSDGTVRNKMIVGHSREEIYLSFLLTTITAAFFFVFAYLLAVLLVGLPPFRNGSSAPCAGTALAATGLWAGDRRIRCAFHHGIHAG